MSYENSQRQKLHTLNNTEDQGKQNSLNSEELIERKQMENTPFWICGNIETGYWLTLGKWRLTEPVKDMDTVEMEVKTNKWNIIVKLIICINNDIKTENI